MNEDTEESVESGKTVDLTLKEGKNTISVKANGKELLAEEDRVINVDKADLSIMPRIDSSKSEDSDVARLRPYGGVYAGVQLPSGKTVKEIENMTVTLVKGDQTVVATPVMEELDHMKDEDSVGPTFLKRAKAGQIFGWKYEGEMPESLKGATITAEVKFKDEDFTHTTETEAKVSEEPGALGDAELELFKEVKDLEYKEDVEYDVEGLDITKDEEIKVEKGKIHKLTVKKDKVSIEIWLRNFETALPEFK